MRDPEEPAPAPRWPFAVALEGARASYPHRRHPAALDGVSLRLDPGERVALVGPSAAGKTTVVKLLLRFLDRRQAGDARGARRSRVSPSRRPSRDRRGRSGVANVHGDICHNVRLARPDASAPEIVQGLRRARIWGWVSGLPDGLDTLVGEQGRELSGSQRQPTVPARALLAAAAGLVLGEPTAHLDPYTARELIAVAFAAARDQGVLLITHRTNGLELFDRVVSLASRPPPTSICHLSMR